MRRHPDLIVPIRDRRQRKRYLTLKNFAWFLGACAVLFVIITIHSEMRGTGSTNYGRLVERELPPTAPPSRTPLDVVTEASPAVTQEATHADPMLAAPMGREQWLHADTASAATPITAVPMPAPVRTGDAKLAIVGGPEGVAIVKEPKKRPTLEGGFGRN
jgi:hypothetical protein